MQKKNTTTPERARTLELLSPAKNLECGIAAIDHGADAVYIGASQFGARASASNSLEDIACLCAYAHRFRVRVYVAFNTILTDNQLELAEQMIWDIYHAGADALIIQDMGILQMNLPPIAIHASTQTDNRTVEKVRFLSHSGFSRVVLARELSLDQISRIATDTDVELEAFVHGALCVSYSGQCYMSQAMCGRSANRGQCAQYCRLPYNLLDADGRKLITNKHLLSLKDLDQSQYLLELAQAGVQSFKIEGRLKDIEYVKNVTAYYRMKIDQMLAVHPEYQKASVGVTRFFFEPNPEKSFRRGASHYFLHQRSKENTQPDTPKSLGEKLGNVLYVGRNFFDLSCSVELNNGDGLCFVNADEQLMGFRINKSEPQQPGLYRCYPAEMPRLQVGMLMYRNLDTQFEKTLRGKTSERKVAVFFRICEVEEGFEFRATDEEGVSCTHTFELVKQLAQKPETVRETVRNQLSRLGNTIYELRDMDIEMSVEWFFQASVLADWRRTMVELLDSKREEAYKRDLPSERKQTLYPEPTLTYLGNVTNKLASTFYRQHGVGSVESGFELKHRPDAVLMYCKHCIKYELGWCPKQGGKTPAVEPLFLEHKGKRFRLVFDCRKCEMQVMG